MEVKINTKRQYENGLAYYVVEDNEAKLVAEDDGEYGSI